MRRGLCSYAFAHEIARGDLDADGLIARAEAWGADCVQLADNVGLPSRPSEIYLETGVRGLAWEPIARAAEATDADWVRLVIDSPGDEPSPAEATDRIGEINRRLGSKRIAIENHDRFPARVLRQIALDSGSSVVLDTANSLGSLEGTETVASVLGDLTVCLHVKDIRPRRVPSQMGFVVEGTAAGEGTVDWPLVFSHLTDRCESLVLETWASDPPEEFAMSERGWVWLRTQPLDRAAIRP